MNLAIEISVNDADDLLRAQLKRVSVRAALDNDEGLSKWISSYFYGGVPPIIRAKTYDSVKPEQEIRAFKSEFHDDPRRPVFMRGSIEVQKARYHQKSTWAYLIADRYLKKIKFTAFYPSETDRMRELICSHMHKRGHYFHDIDGLVGHACSGTFGASYCLDGKRHAHVTVEEWRRVRRYKNGMSLLEPPPSLVIPPHELAEITPPRPVQLTLMQKKTAAYRALVELGIQI